jgi:hypothetical protein
MQKICELFRLREQVIEFFNLARLVQCPDFDVSEEKGQEPVYS